MWILIGIIISIAISDCASGPNTPTPQILTSSQTFRVAVGDSVVLPCSVQDLGSLVLLWKRQQDVLTAGKLMVNPDVNRFQLVNGYNLQIRNIGATDAGDYTCHITTFGQPVTLTHTLEILVPPSVTADPTDGNYVVKKGRRVELNCRASGNPKPKIYWSREGDVLPSGEKSVVGQSLVIESVDRHDSGLYQCKATNGVGSPATANINLQVLCVMSSNDVGPGKWWDGDTVTLLGSPVDGVGPIDYLGHSIQDRAAQCCDECLNQYPATTMINFLDELWWCDCLTATPGKTPSTDPTYFVGTCGNAAFPDLVVDGTGTLDSSSVGYKGYINVIGDSSRCCEKCNSDYPGTEIFEQYGNNLFCYASRPGMKPFIVPTTDYADFCSA